MAPRTKRYSKEVTVVTQPNQGAAAARNKAYSLSHGDYIQWLDADDLLAPDKIATQMEAFTCGTSKRTLVSGAWAYFMYRPQKARFMPTALWCDMSPLEWLLRKWEHNLHMQPATWLVSRELTEAAGYWDSRVQSDDDGEYFCRVIVASDGIRFIPEARIFYRMSGLRSLSFNRSQDAHLLGMRLQIGHVRSMDDSERTRAACVRYLQTWLPYFYPERMDLVTEAKQMATGLGGHLEIPRLSWKYAWMEPLFGRCVAKQVQLRYNDVKWSIRRTWDRALFRSERQTT